MTNMIVEQHFDVFDMTLALRHQMLDILTDADLAFTLLNNPSLGVLCREHAELDHIYAQSFKTFKQDWSYKASNAAELEGSVEALRKAFATTEQEIKDTIAAMSNEELETKTIDRGGFAPSAGTQFHIYRENLLIFYAKASIYLNALNKELSEQWRTWIG